MLHEFKTESNGEDSHSNYTFYTLEKWNTIFTQNLNWGIHDVKPISLIAKTTIFSFCQKISKITTYLKTYQDIEKYQA